MRAIIVIAIMAGSMFMITLSHATEMDQGDKSKQTMEQKQADKDERVRKRSAAIPDQWEKNGQADPVRVERVVVKMLRRLSTKEQGRKRNNDLNCTRSRLPNEGSASSDGEPSLCDHVRLEVKSFLLLVPDRSLRFRLKLGRCLTNAMLLRVFHGVLQDLHFGLLANDMFTSG